MQGVSGRLLPGTLYRALSRLLENGLVEASDQRPDPELDDERRRYYRLTDLGRRVIEADGAAVGRAGQSGAGQETAPQSEARIMTTTQSTATLPALHGASIGGCYGLTRQSFARPHGAEMLQVFRTSLRAEYRQRGKVGVAHLWLLTIFDVAMNALALRPLRPRRSLARNESTRHASDTTKEKEKANDE